MPDQNFNIWMMISVMLIVSLACSLGSVDLLGTSDLPNDPESAPEENLLEAVFQDELPVAEQLPTFTPNKEPSLGIGATIVNPVDGAVMVYVPEGEFLMGSEDEKAASHEKPEHLVYLDAFWIYQHEVTNDEYRQCVVNGGCTQPEHTTEYVDQNYYNHPVRYVSWFGAQTYCNWAGGRLPTEAEWEKAARGTDGRNYPWGNESPECTLALYGGCKSSEQRPKPVGSYPLGASPYGVLDMAGNVWEWVADWYSDDYYNYSPNKNPAGPPSGEFRVIRGGSWFPNSSFLRVSARYWDNEGGGYHGPGFRCVHDESP